MDSLSSWETADAGGGLKGPRNARALQGFGGRRHQQASAGYIPGHCLQLLSGPIKRD